MIYKSAGKYPSWTGQDIGILVLDCAYPFVPGNVANARTFPFPVRYAVVEGANPQRLILDADPELITPFVTAARQLEREGVKAITGACGFMALFQKELQAAVDIPVFSSSLMQIPFMHALTGRAVGIITADSRHLKPAHFSACSIRKDTPVHIAGMESVKAFTQSVMDDGDIMDSAAVGQGAVRMAKSLCDANPDIGSILLECSDLPPYAADIAAETGRPVFDFITMIKHVEMAVRPARYGE